MRKWLTATLVVGLSLGLVACGAPKYRDGTYEGTGQGNNGSITIEVMVENSQLSRIVVLDQAETESYYLLAEGMIPKILEKKGTKGVDAVAGATNSCNGIIEAIDNALSLAK